MVIRMDFERGMLRLDIGPDFDLPEYNVPPNNNATAYNYTFPGSLSPLRSTTKINAFASDDTEEDDCYTLQTRLSIPGNFTAGMAENQGTAYG